MNNTFWQNLLSNWKSTVANLLTLVIMTTGYFAAIPAVSLTQLGITPKELLWATIIGGLAKIYIGLITKDAK